MMLQIQLALIDLLSTNDLVSQTESELSFMDDVTSAETVPLVDLQVNDRVVWPSDEGYERAVVKWIGSLPEEEALQGEILVGVEFVSNNHPSASIPGSVLAMSTPTNRYQR